MRCRCGGLLEVVGAAAAATAPEGPTKTLVESEVLSCPRCRARWANPVAYHTLSADAAVPDHNRVILGWRKKRRA